MTRKESRELAFILLFEQAVTGEQMSEIIGSAEELREVEVKGFTLRLACGTDNNNEIIDETINKHAKGWKVSRLSKVSAAILRLCVYELLFEKDIPVSVSINEAIDLAKVYGGKDDAPYVNGVLSGIAKDTSIKFDKDDKNA